MEDLEIGNQIQEYVGIDLNSHFGDSHKIFGVDRLGFGNILEDMGLTLLIITLASILISLIIIGLKKLSKRI